MEAWEVRYRAPKAEGWSTVLAEEAVARAFYAGLATDRPWMDLRLVAPGGRVEEERVGRMS